MLTVNEVKDVGLSGVFFIFSDIEHIRNISGKHGAKSKGGQKNRLKSRKTGGQE